MAVPFYIPEVDESTVTSTTSSTQNSPTNSPSRPIPIPLRVDQPSPQQSPIDNEVLVQAFYEALCRCSQGLYDEKNHEKSGERFFLEPQKTLLNCFISKIISKHFFLTQCTISATYVKTIFKTLKKKKQRLFATTTRSAIVEWAASPLSSFARDVNERKWK